MGVVLLAEVVATSAAVAGTRSRATKIGLLADLLVRLERDEIEPVVAFLAGEPRQGKVGVGWASLAGLTADAASGAAVATLTVSDLDRAVAELAAVGGSGSASQRQAALRSLGGRATDAEAVFIRRLLLGDLRQGALAGVVTDAVARAAGVPVGAVRRAVMLAGDLPAAAAAALAGGEEALAGIGLEVLRPVQPMLASAAADVGAAIDDLGPASVEWKLDGARVQAHRAGDEVRLFTRNLNDVTARLPAVVAIVAALPVTSIVLDGEVVGVGEDERPDRFQDTMSRFGRHQGSDLVVAFFDVLHLDGVDLLDRPLTERIEVLRRVADRWRVPSLLTGDRAEAASFFEAALAAGHEGVMVKAAGSAYEAGRRGLAWRKVKPVRTLDLVVLAVEWGHGRRRGWLSNLHLGARHAAGDGFVMVGKTFKGLTDDLLRWQTSRFGELAVSDDGHVVTVRPEVVVEIAVDGAQVSTRYPGGVALRFARVKRYRPDKSPAEADPIDAVRALLDRA